MASGVFDSSNPSVPAVGATGTDGADGLYSQSDTGVGVVAISDSSFGALGFSVTSVGVVGASGGPAAEAIALRSALGEGSIGVFAQSQSGIGVHAVGGGATATAGGPLPVAAVFAEGGPGIGINATSDSTAIIATSGSGIGVEASCQNGPGIQGGSITSTGVSGTTESGIGVAANGGSAGVALQVIGKVEVQGNSVGSITMAKNAKTLTVPNAAATANSLILLTPLDDPQAFLWIGARSAGSFTIEASEALPTKVNIAFLIIN